MRSRGTWAGAAVLALLAACGRDEPPPEPKSAESPPALVAPFVPPVVPPATPVPSASPSEPLDAPASASPTPLAAYPPRDECARLSGFAAFREALQAALAKRDGEALVALADPAIRLDFGGGAGSEELGKRLADPTRGLWEEIAALVALGCAADGTVATMPAIFSRVPDDIDAARTMLVTGTAVPLRRKPSPGAAMVRSLDWALVTIKGDGFDPGSRYAEVTAPDGSGGYVATAKLRSVLDYRLIADKESDGAYRITALIAGD